MEFHKTVKKQISQHLTGLSGKTICLKKCHNWTAYYCYENGKQTFIPKTDTKTIKALERKNYYTQLDKRIESNLEKYRKIQKIMDTIDPLDEVFFNLPENKRHLIEPFRFEDPTTKKLLASYGPGSSYDKDNIRNDRYKSRTRETNSGYLVRSKSEVEIADEATRRGLPFLYEFRIRLTTKDGHTTIVYPDFTFYNPVTEKFIFYEHFGKVDDPVYAAENFPKLATYLDSGLVLNKDLFITTEGKNHNFTKREINRILDLIEEELS